MEGIEIVRNWNKVKGTKYTFASGSDCSAIVKRVNYLIERVGEEKVTEYFENALSSNERDIWVVADLYRLNKWISEETARKEKKEVEEKKKEDMSILNLLGSEIVRLMGNELANNIGKEVERKINEYVQDKTLIKVIEYKNEHKKIEGVAHEQLETILKFVAMDEPVMMVGPAGTGKNVIAKQVADALGLDFYFSNAVTQEYKITGYGDANGEFVKTQFFDAFTKGGLFLLDEMDASCPEALVVLNCAIANRYFDFPVIGRVEAHPNFRVIANANTFGTGASMEYVGRNQLDGATLNRFALVEVNYDKRVEESVCPDKDIVDFCREFRKACNKNGVQHIVSYREMSRLYKMINVAKMDKDIALKTCLTKGLERDSLQMIMNSMDASLTYIEELKKVIKSI